MKRIITMVIALFIIGFPLLAHSPDKIEEKPAYEVIRAIEPEPFEVFECTAYDLSVQSCGKNIEHPAFGITASGYSLRNHSRESSMAIAVDPSIIPLGSEVLIVFENERHSKYTGIYKAVDTGTAIKGNRIDIFFGDHGESVSEEALQFGRVYAKIYRI